MGRVSWKVCVCVMHWYTNNHILSYRYCSEHERHTNQKDEILIERLGVRGQYIIKWINIRLWWIIRGTKSVFVTMLHQWRWRNIWGYSSEVTLWRTMSPTWQETSCEDVPVYLYNEEKRTVYYESTHNFKNIYSISTAWNFLTGGCCSWLRVICKKKKGKLSQKNNPLI